MTADEALTELVRLVREQLRWQRAVSIPAVRIGLESLLTSTAMRKAYELCDGQRTYREIAQQAGVSLGAVSSWSRRWRDAGVVYEDAAGRVVHLVDLASLGLAVEVAGSETASTARRR